MGHKTKAQQRKEDAKHRLTDFELREFQKRITLLETTTFLAKLIEGNTALFNGKGGGFFSSGANGKTFAFQFKTLADLVHRTNNQWCVELLASKGFKDGENVTIDILTGSITPNESPKAAN